MPSPSRRARARRRASRVGVVGGGNSAGQAAVWLSRGGALVTLLHRRADLRETMSAYLIRDLDRYGVAVRDSGRVAARAMPNLVEAMSRNPGLAEALRDRFLAGRRAGLRRVLERGIERDDLRPDLDIGLALDVLAGPLFYRLLITCDRSMNSSPRESRT